MRKNEISKKKVYELLRIQNYIESYMLLTIFSNNKKKILISSLVIYKQKEQLLIIVSKVYSNKFKT